MNFKDLLKGFIFESIGVFLMLFFRLENNTPFSLIKWLGIVIMIGGPLVFWEILPFLNEMLPKKSKNDNT